MNHPSKLGEDELLLFNFVTNKKLKVRCFYCGPEVYMTAATDHCRGQAFLLSTSVVVPSMSIVSAYGKADPTSG